MSDWIRELSHLSAWVSKGKVHTQSSKNEKRGECVSNEGIFCSCWYCSHQQPLDSQRSEALHPVTLRHHHRRHPPSHWMKNPMKNWTGMTF